MNKYILQAVSSQQSTVLSPFDLLFDSTGEPLYDSNSQRLKTVKA